MLKRLFRRRRAAAPSPLSDWKARNEALVARLRRQGVSIGTGCVIFTDQFSLEPCLVEIGDRVAIAGARCSSPTTAPPGCCAGRGPRPSTSAGSRSAATPSSARTASSCPVPGSARTVSSGPARSSGDARAAA